MARPQVNTNLGGGESIQPMASPMGIQAPVATVQKHGLLSLAESLSSVAPELNQFLEEEKAIYREKEANRAYDTIQGMTFEQAKEAVANGTMRGTESPWFRAAFQKQFGMAHAANRRREIITAYNNEFDKDGGNIDEFLAGYARADAEAYGNSEFISAGMREGMAGLFDEVRNNQAAYVDSKLQSRATDQFYAIARSEIDTAISEGGDVNSAINAVVSQHTEAGLIDEAQSDEALMALASEYASNGDMAGAEAVLNADPYGKGSLASRGSTALKAKEILATGQGNQTAAARAASIVPRSELELRAANGALTETDRKQVEEWVGTGLLTPDAAEGILTRDGAARQKKADDASSTAALEVLNTRAADLIVSGQGAVVQDTEIQLPNGTTKTVKASDLKDTFIQEQVGQLIGAKGGGVAVAAQHMASWGLSETFKPWQDSLSGGYLALTGALMKPNKDGVVTIPPATQAAYGLYKELAGTEKLRNIHIKDPTAAAVYRDAEILESLQGLTPEEALKTSAQAHRDGDAGAAQRVDYSAFESSISDVISPFYFASDPINANDARMVLDQHTRLLMALGVSQDRAVKEAVKSFKESNEVINGVYVNTRDRLVPTNIGEISSSYIEEYLQAHPEYSEAYFVPDAQQDYWTITDEFGLALRAAPVIHISEFPKRLADKAKAAVDAELAAKAAEEEEKKKRKGKNKARADFGLGASNP